MKTFKDLKNELQEVERSTLMGGSAPSFKDKATVAARKYGPAAVGAAKTISTRAGIGLPVGLAAGEMARSALNRLGSGADMDKTGTISRLNKRSSFSTVGTSPYQDMPDPMRGVSRTSPTPTKVTTKTPDMEIRFPVTKPVTATAAKPSYSGEINVARNNPPRNADVPTGVKPAPVTVSKPAVSKLVAAKPKTPSIVPPKPDELKQQVGVTARAVAGPSGTQFQNIARGSKPESGMFKKVGTAPSEPKNLAPQGSVERDTQLAKLGFKKF
jgi:hypothetical protein